MGSQLSILLVLRLDCMTIGTQHITLRNLRSKRLERYSVSDPF
jgi:hypothetical protein